jgi:hypothetical protein
MVHSNAIPDLDGAIGFSDKCNKLRTTLFPASNEAISIIPENFVASQRDLSDTFTPVSRSEVKRVFRAIITLIQRILILFYTMPLLY